MVVNSLTRNSTDVPFLGCVRFTVPVQIELKLPQCFLVPGTATPSPQGPRKEHRKHRESLKYPARKS